MSNIKRIRGFQDLYGVEAKKYRYISEVARDIFKRYNFSEIIIPYVEDVNLFIRSVGEETDIVQKEMYVFKDKKDRDIALRPEGTASVVRAYIEEKFFAKGGYTKLFYEGAMFRYERPQSGRYRQFHQIGAELFGSSSVLSDVEIIKLVKDILDRLKIKTDLEINTLGSFEDRKNYLEVLKNFLKGKKENLCEDCKNRLDRNPLRVLDCKVEKCKEETKNAPLLLDYLSESSIKRYEELKRYLDALDIKYKENPRLVRGLDYYTDTVFEFISNKIGAQGTVAAGGRYDKLVEQLGGPSVPAVGFAAGIERLMLLIEDLPLEKPIVAVIPIDNVFNPLALKTTAKLRENNINTELILKEGSLKSKMKLANKFNAYFVIFVSDKYELKDMETGNQLSFEDLNSLISSLEEELKNF